MKRACFLIILNIILNNIAFSIPIVKTWTIRYTTFYTSVALQGAIIPETDNASVYFEYGLQGEFSERTDIQTITSAGQVAYISQNIKYHTSGLYNYRLILEENGQTYYGNVQNFKIITPHAPLVVTGKTSPVGTTETVSPPSITLNGSVNAYGKPTYCYFEYGLSTNYTYRTDNYNIGPARNSYYIESWDIKPPVKIWYYDFYGYEAIYNTAGGYNLGYISTVATMQTIDQNHIHGIGPITLSLYTYPFYAFSPYIAMGGDFLDFRDAWISIQMRGNGLELNNSDICFWAQAQPLEDYSNTTTWIRANWAYNNDNIEKSIIDGIWTKHDFILENDASKWTYAGNNLAQSRPWRYSYYSLDAILNNLNVDWFFNIKQLDLKHMPSGNIDFDELCVNYRTHSILYQSNGAELIKYPNNCVEDPYSLTDGYRNGENKMWHSAFQPTEPIEFIYKFEKTIVPTTIIIYQNNIYPSKSIEIYGSLDNSSYIFIDQFDLAMPDVDNINSAFVRKTYASLGETRYIKFVITNGYLADYWGLGEIKVFGNGAVKRPGDEISGVNIDITNLEENIEYHYRLVAVSDYGTTYGEDKTFTINTTTSLDAPTPSNSVNHNILLWDSVNSAITYEVQVSDNPDFLNPHTFFTGIRTCQIDYTKPLNTIQYWRVRAVNGRKLSEDPNLLGVTQWSEYKSFPMMLYDFEATVFENSPLMIRWSADIELVSLIKIEYSLDNGFSWQKIIDKIPASNTFYLWNEIPAMNSQTLQLRISSDDIFGYYDVLNNPIVLTSTPPILDEFHDVIMDEDTEYSFPIIFTDVSEGDSHVINVQSNNTHVKVKGSGMYSGAIYTIVPDSNYFGEATITVSVLDSSGLMCKRNFQIVINDVNDPPSLDIPDKIFISYSDTYSIDLSEYLTDIDTSLENIEITCTGKAYMDISVNGFIILFKINLLWNNSEVVSIKVLDSNLIIEKKVELILLPRRTKLYQNFPNPFHDSTSIVVDVANPGDILLSIYNSKGLIIREIARNFVVAGRYTFSWDGIDKHGRQVPSGLYWCVVHYGVKRYVIKVVYLK